MIREARAKKTPRTKLRIGNRVRGAEAIEWSRRIRELA
jgi:hypothetical protein